MKWPLPCLTTPALPLHTLPPNRCSRTGTPDVACAQQSGAGLPSAPVTGCPPASTPPEPCACTWSTTPSPFMSACRPPGGMAILHRVFPLYRWMTSMPPSWCATMTLGGARGASRRSGRRAECPRPPRRSGAGGAPFPRHAALIAPARARATGLVCSAPSAPPAAPTAGRRPDPTLETLAPFAVRWCRKCSQPERGVFALPPRVRQRVDHHALESPCTPPRRSGARSTPAP